ncbi:MAG: COX15/CtaA family protein, partial [Candidatus Latescibacteria bacterium]|nr:COX15/CtaA family protein [Candidatus Latescibacterota bacterium]
MPHGVSRPVKIWLFAITVIVVVLIVFGGFVRLSQSGLSMVEWH